MAAANPGGGPPTEQELDHRPAPGPASASGPGPPENRPGLTPEIASPGSPSSPEHRQSSNQNGRQSGSQNGSSDSQGSTRHSGHPLEPTATGPPQWQKSQATAAAGSDPATGSIASALGDNTTGPADASHPGGNERQTTPSAAATRQPPPSEGSPLHPVRAFPPLSVQAMRAPGASGFYL